MYRENREYRNIPMFIIEKREEGTDPSFLVRGYASTFDPYFMYSDENGTKYYEKIEPSAFEGCDFSDVVFVKNHEGTVFARTKNGTLKLFIDLHGLLVEADLSRTASARAMFEEIEAGMYYQMSLAFVVDDEEYDRKTHTRIIKHIAKCYDVSAVNFPANPGTEISPSTRSKFDGFIELEKAERLEEQRSLELEKAKFEFLEV